MVEKVRTVRAYGKFRKKLNWLVRTSAVLFTPRFEFSQSYIFLSLTRDLAINLISQYHVGWKYILWWFKSWFYILDVDILSNIFGKFIKFDFD